MADLNDLQASLAVKIAGANSTGSETNFVDATVNGLKVDPGVVQSTAPSQLYTTSGSITAADVASTITTGIGNQNIYSGTPTTGSVVELTLINADAPAFTFEVTGTFSANLVAEYSIDNGTTWIRGSIYAVINTITSSISSNGVGVTRCPGANKVRVRCDDYTSGTALVAIKSVQNAEFDDYALETTQQSIDSNLSTLNGKFPNQEILDGELIAVDDTVEIITDNYETVTLSINIPGTANVVLEGTSDGLNWTVLKGYSEALNFAGTLVTTSSARIGIPCGGMSKVRTRLLATSGGTIQVELHSYKEINNITQVALFAPSGVNVNATQSGTWNITNVSGTVSLPTGASTSALQTTGNTSLASIDTKLTSGAQKTQIVDGAGNVIDSISSATGIDNLLVAQGATNFIASTANSTTTQLTAGSTFTGTIETIFSQQTISILLTCDVAGTLTLNQYIDAGGTRRTNQWAYSIVGGVPFSRSFTGNGNFFNLTFQNTSASTSTTLNINTAYGTLFPASNLGNVPVSLDEMGGTALTVGQKTMAASIPVVISSNQSAIPVSGSFSLGSGTKATYVVNTGPITGATATGTKSLAYLWHPSAVSLTYKLTSVIIDQIQGNGSPGSMRIEMNRITAENATPGGTTGTIVSTLSTNAASGATLRIAPTGAPTRAAGTLFGVNSPVTANGQTVPVGLSGTDTLENTLWTVPPSTAQGYEITQVVVSTLSTAPIFNLTITWTEA